MQALRTYRRLRISSRFPKHCAYLHRNVPTVSTRKFTPRNCITAFSTVSNVPDETVDILTFEKVCEETLESLTEYFEHVVEAAENFKSGDVSYSGGVLTVSLGPDYGTYVINRQTPNRQIWLSSPKSGPKRYDFVDNSWVYKHDGQSLHRLLQNEVSKMVNFDVNFATCAYAKL